MSIKVNALELTKNIYGAVRNFENPLITKELRTRMRAGKAHWTMLVYVMLLSVVLFVVYYGVWMDSMYSGGISNWAQRRVGFLMFTSLAWCQMGLLAIIGPALTSGSLTLEHEQQTFEMLSLTSLTPRNIIAGKAGAPIIFTSMLLASSLPLAGLCLIFGGISPIEIAVTYVLLAAWAFLFCSLGVFWSSILTKTSVASLFTYGTGLAYVILSMIFAAPGFIPGGRDEFILGTLNPGWSAHRALVTVDIYGISMPLSLVALVINVGLGFLMLTTAQTHVKYHRIDKALAVRLQLLSLSAFVFLVIFGNIASFMHYIGGSRMGRELNTVILILIMIPVFIFLPAFSTGVVRCCRSGLSAYLLSGLNPRSAFSQELNGGYSFILIWLAVCTGTGIVAHISAKIHQAIPELAITMIAVAAVALAYYCFGVFASTFTANRNLAIVLLFLFIIISFVMYPVLISNYSFGDQTPKTRYELAYFWPALPIVTMESGFHRDALGPKLAADPHLHWLAVTMCYLAMSAVFLHLASYCKQRNKGITDE